MNEKEIRKRFVNWYNNLSKRDKELWGNGDY